MKYIPFILRNLFRKKTRTLLTVGSIAVALFLFGLLVAIETAPNAGVDVAGADRLVVRLVRCADRLVVRIDHRLHRLGHGLVECNLRRLGLSEILSRPRR